MREETRRAYARRTSERSGRLTPITAEEYFAREWDAPGRVRHEFVDGQVYAMSPASKRHSTIAMNIAHKLRGPARSKSCHLYQDVMVRVSDQRCYYPDVVIACDPPDADDRIVSVPCFVVEVTSPTTRSTDLREKVPTYRANQFLRGFLIVEQKRRRVFSYRRTETGEWDGVELTGSGTLAVPCAETTLSLDEIYEGLDLPRMTVRDGEEEYTIEEYERAWAHHDAFLVATRDRAP